MNHNSSEEFIKYPKNHLRISRLNIDKYTSALPNVPVGMTPNIIEERQMNIAVMDVFSRLMMDRVMFLGTAINDQVANIIQAQLLFLQSVEDKLIDLLYNKSESWFENKISIFSARINTLGERVEDTFEIENQSQVRGGKGSD